MSNPYPPGFGPDTKVKMVNRCPASSYNSIPFPLRFEPQGDLSKNDYNHVETGNDEYGKKGDHEESLGDDFENDVLVEAKRSWELAKMLGLSAPNEIDVI